jgi:hypothetical protein
MNIAVFSIIITTAGQIATGMVARYAGRVDRRGRVRAPWPRQPVAECAQSGLDLPYR